MNGWEVLLLVALLLVSLRFNLRERIYEGVRAMQGRDYPSTDRDGRGGAILYLVVFAVLYFGAAAVGARIEKANMQHTVGIVGRAWDEIIPLAADKTTEISLSSVASSGNIEICITTFNTDDAPVVLLGGLEAIVRDNGIYEGSGFFSNITKKGYEGDYYASVQADILKACNSLKVNMGGKVYEYFFVFVP